MNFTSSPYEHTMEEVHHDEKHIPQKAPKDRLVRIIRIGRVLSKFSAARSTSKSRDKRLVGIWPPTEARHSGFGGKGGIVGASEGTAFDGCKDAELVPARVCGGSPTSVFCGLMGCKK